MARTTKLTNDKDSTVLFVRKLVEMRIPLKGPVALCLAEHFHRLGMDSPGQWGNAYFRCPECDEARDCTGEEEWDEPFQVFCDCYCELSEEDLQISEGWAERL